MLSPYLSFQSTPPHEGATSGIHTSQRLRQFQSTPPHEGATSEGSSQEHGQFPISIHAPS